MYAIFRALGKQFRAEKGQVLRLPLMHQEPGAKVTFDEVLGEGKERKIYVFKFKRRKNYRRKTGHRQRFTEVRITNIRAG